MSATKCDGCGYVSKEHEEEDDCPFCDGGVMEPLTTEQAPVATLQHERGVRQNNVN